jgi:hypothetical protein
LESQRSVVQIPQHSLSGADDTQNRSAGNGLWQGFAAAFSVAGERQEKAADEKTRILLEGFSDNPDVEKARTDFERAQKIEETFYKDFDGSTSRVREC